MAAAIRCPYCEHRMAIKDPRPGIYGPRCPQCRQKFQVDIGDDETDTPRVSKLRVVKAEDAINDDIAAALGIEVPKPKPKPRASSTQGKAKGLRKPITAGADSTAGMTALPSSSESVAGLSGTHQALTDTHDALGGTHSGTSVIGERLADESIAGGSFAGEGAIGPNGSLPQPLNDPMADASSASTPAASVDASSDIGATSRPSPRAGETSKPSPAEHRTDAQPVDHAAPTFEPLDLLGKTLGGFQITKKLGQGGMGSVFLARQTSLDRNVAVKVLNPELAADPQLVSRFTREAYAAAQLVHHNVVQIYDIGEQKDVHFFGMEFVEGQTLSGLVKEHGKLDPEVAAGYTLQAARGLKFAHDHGMVHRDIKPDNLLLNEQGIVKVADLGLVKTDAPNRGPGVSPASSDLNSKERRDELNGRDARATGVGISMGTPAYMAPEQAVDAAKVDHRADIYSLGCTLFDLLTGRPPFSGKTAIEVLTKHQHEAPPSVERLNNRVPKSLSALVTKMMAKVPGDRYDNMGIVVRELEDFLGLDGSKPFSPREEHASMLGIFVSGFNNAKFAKIRSKLIPAFFAVCAVLILLGFALTSSPLLWGGGFVGFTVLTVLSYIVLTGLTERTHLFLKLRQLVFGARIIDWLKYILVGSVLIGLLVLLDLHLIWLGFLVAAGLVAAGFHFTIDLLLKRERAESITRSEALFKQLRLKGLDEDNLRQFVAKFAGERWEEYYENLFGYESKLYAREFWVRGEGAKKAKKHAAWRDPVAKWINASLEARKAEREQRHLQKVEARKLKSEGVSDVEAKKKAKKTAERMVDKAASLREVSQQRSAATSAPGVAKTLAKTSSAKLDADSISVVRPGYMDDEPGGAEPERVRESYIQRKYGGWHGLVVGPQTRFALGILLLLGFGLWLYQNKSVPVTQILTKSADVLNQGHNTLSNESQYLDPAKVVQAGDFKPPAKPLELPFVPPVVLGLFSTYNCGIAGALLVLSCLFPGSKLGWFLIPGALLMFAGHLIPGVPEASELPFISRFVQTATLFPVTLAAGGILSALGLVFARK